MITNPETKGARTTERVVANNLDEIGKTANELKAAGFDAIKVEQKTINGQDKAVVSGAKMPNHQGRLFQ